MKRTTPAENRALDLEAFDTLFNKRDYVAGERYGSPDSVLVEHWDVIEDEASRAESKSGLPMFGADFSE